MTTQPDIAHHEGTPMQMTARAERMGSQDPILPLDIIIDMKTEPKKKGPSTRIKVLLPNCAGTLLNRWGDHPLGLANTNTPNRGGGSRLLDLHAVLHPTVS